jgi:hypothetical protein
VVCGGWFAPPGFSRRFVGRGVSRRRAW